MRAWSKADNIILMRICYGSCYYLQIQRRDAETEEQFLDVVLPIVEHNLCNQTKTQERRARNILSCLLFTDHTDING